MYSLSLYTHRNLFRWDMLTRFLPKNIYEIPQINKIDLRMHENHSQNYKDRFVLAFILETIGMQRLSNKMIIKNKYQKNLTVKRSSTELSLQLTLRRQSAHRFLDTFLFYTVPQSNAILQYKDLKVSSRGETSLYYEEFLNVPGMPRLSTMIHVVPSLQIHISGMFLQDTYLEYILSSYRFPKTSENTIINPSIISYNFFDK